MKNATIRSYLMMLYLMNLEPARHAFDASLSLDGRVLCGLALAVGLVDLWIAVRFDAMDAQHPALAGRVVGMNLALSLVWNLALAAVGNAQPWKLAAGLVAGGIALACARPLRSSTSQRPSSGIVSIWMEPRTPLSLTEV